MKARDDEGSVLVLGIGLSLVCVLVATVAINVATVWLARTSLDSVADGAALAGVQAIDSASVYRDGLSGITRISPSLARTKVHAYLSRPEVQSQVHGLKLRSVVVNGNSVQVTVSCFPAMPFGYLWDAPTVIARSKARAINYVKWSLDAASAQGNLGLVATGDFQVDLSALNNTLQSIEKVLNVDSMNAQIVELEAAASAPDLWDDQANAQKVTSQLSVLQADVARIKNLRSRIDDVAVLHELGEIESDASIVVEAANELAALEKAIGELEVRTLLSGEYDHREALVTIRSGAGGVDAADWAEMLLRMYMRYCERHGWGTEIYDTSYAEEAGIKSATFAVKAPYAYGTLSVEQGTHRLVRISPFDNQSRRQTSFAEVEVIPVVEQTDSVDIPDDDIRIDVYRSSGPGGQGVNTTDSAVRLTHIPTGIVVSCQNERSQLQNKATAMAVLQAKILERTRQEEQAKINQLKGDAAGSWGNQMRSYVLHPYQMVKDIRTEEETGNTSAVLDGEIDSFVEAGIRWRREQANT